MDHRKWVSAAVLLVVGLGRGGASAQPTTAPEPEAVVEAPPQAGYDGGFFIQSADGSYRLVITGRVQPQLQALFPEEGDNQGAFSIRRARVSLKGHAFMPELTYLFQADFGRGSVNLLDYYANYAFTDGLELRIGQWKRPFSRQLITSSGRLELVDRALTNEFFNADRDMGLAVHNGYESSPDFEWVVGVFNGSGIGSRLQADVEVDPATGEGTVVSARTTNVPSIFFPSLVFRVGVNTGGVKGYSEADLEGGDLRFGAGLSGRADFDAGNDDASRLRGELDFLLKANGFGANAAVYVSTLQDGETLGDQTFEAWGAHLQLGYVIAEQWQPVARYAIVDPDAGGREQEIALGFSAYFGGHNLKWQTDGALLLEEAEDTETQDVRVRTQLTFAF